MTTHVDASLYAPRGRILIVDDDALIRQFTTDSLSVDGHEVVAAVDGQSAMGILATDGAAFDVVVLDWLMPGLSGREVLEGLRARWSVIELPVIMATSRDASVDIVRALNAGANDYIVKPFDSQVLLARVRSQLRVKRLADLRIQFAELISHDLRGLLTVLKGGTAALKMALPPGRPMTPPAFQLLSNLHDNAMALQTMLEDFLKVKGMDDVLTPQMHSFPINAVVRQVISFYGAYAMQKGVSIDSALDAVDPSAYGDEKIVRHVLQNLIDNAIKFGSAGTHVVVRTTAVDDRVRVEVKDDGPGIPTQDLADLFVKGKPLTNRPTAGEPTSHVGLPMCRYYLQLHGSDLLAANDEEGGVRFWFTVPLAQVLA